MLLYKLDWVYTVYIFGRRSCEVSWCTSYCFWFDSKLLTIIDFVLERVGININFLLLVSLSFPTPLQHPHAVVFAFGGNTLCDRLVIGSHHSCQR